MSQKTLINAKNQKVFLPLDLVIYGAIALTIALLFILFVFAPQKEALQGISIIYSDQNAEHTIFTYDFETNKYQIADDFKDKVNVKASQDQLKVTIYFFAKEKTEVNILIIDTKGKTVRMLDADCSYHKDCVKMQIANSRDTIICVPHHLIIKPTNSDSGDITLG
ncbi:MAG: NusG domain II-containing protein [Clostridia bacterium]